MKFLIITGKQNTGKTSLIKRFIYESGKWEYAKIGSLNIMRNRTHNIFCIGHYFDNEKSKMGIVQPRVAFSDFKLFIEKLSKRPDSVAIAEASAVITKKNINFCMENISTTILELVINEKEDLIRSVLYPCIVPKKSLKLSYDARVLENNNYDDQKKNIEIIWDVFNKKRIYKIK